MPYAGKQLLPREVARAASAHWKGLELVKAVATCLGESSGSVGAWHDNEDSGGEVASRDCGLFQINIPARQIGTPVEFALRTESLEPNVVDAVVTKNLRAAYDLYKSPWPRESGPDERRWQPWYAYTQGWATFPEWFIWARPDLDHWAATGRYIQKAIVGVANYRIVFKGDSSLTALAKAQYWQSKFKVKGTLSILESPKPVPWIGLIGWTEHPPKPTEPPADGVGPRPVENNGI